MTSPASSLVFGLDTFGDLNHEEGRPVSHAQTIRNVVEQGVLTEDVGSISFGIGGHHPEDFLMPDGDVVLAAIAAASARRKSSENWAERARAPDDRKDYVRPAVAPDRRAFRNAGYSQASLMNNVELYGTGAVPQVRELLGAASLA